MSKTRGNQHRFSGPPGSQARPEDETSDGGNQNLQHGPRRFQHVPLGGDPGKGFEGQAHIPSQGKLPAGFHHVTDGQVCQGGVPVHVDDAIDPLPCRRHFRGAFQQRAPAEEPRSGRQLGVRLRLLAIDLEGAPAGERLFDIHRSDAQVPADSNARQHALLPKPLEGPPGNPEACRRIIEFQPLIV